MRIHAWLHPLLLVVHSFCFCRYTNLKTFLRWCGIFFVWLFNFCHFFYVQIENAHQNRWMEMHLLSGETKIERMYRLRILALESHYEVISPQPVWTGVTVIAKINPFSVYIGMRVLLLDTLEKMWRHFFADVCNHSNIGFCNQVKIFRHRKLLVWVERLSSTDIIEGVELFGLN